MHSPSSSCERTLSGSKTVSLGPKYSYTPAGRLAERTWARNVVTTYDYNGAGDLEEITYSDGTPGVNSFDRRGRKIGVASPALESSLFYDDVGNLTGEAWSAGPLSGLRITNQFDQLAQFLGLAVSLPHQGKSV